MKLYQAIARAVDARTRCLEAAEIEARIGDTDAERARLDWGFRHKGRADDLCREYLPFGAGWDLGTKIDWDRSTGERLIFYGAFHHMDEHGGYAGWTDHEIWVRPSLGFDVTVDVKGRNRNDIKDYLGEMFDNDLRADVDEWEGMRDDNG